MIVYVNTFNITLKSQLQHFIVPLPKLIKVLPEELGKSRERGGNDNVDTKGKQGSAVITKKDQHVVNHVDLVFPANFLQISNTDFILPLNENFTFLKNIQSVIQ